MVSARAESDAGPLATAASTSSSPDHSLSTTAQLPSWVQAAMEQEKLSQPWKQHAGAERDDPDFAQSRDTVSFYDDKIKVCYGEGSMAA